MGSREPGQVGWRGWRCRRAGGQQGPKRQEGPEWQEGWWAAGAGKAGGAPGAGGLVGRRGWSACVDLLAFAFMPKLMHKLKLTLKLTLAACLHAWVQGEQLLGSAGPYAQTQTRTHTQAHYGFMDAG